MNKNQIKSEILSNKRKIIFSMHFRGVKTILSSESLQLGGKTIEQSLPSRELENHDPFLLLHHAGPYELKGEQAHFYVGPHPHRGFEPITFVFQGGVRHKDSLGNDSSIEAPGVQWISAGKGIIHSEQSSTKFEDQGGNFELIQLWVNLPSNLKMENATYMKCDEEELEEIELKNKGNSKVYLISGKEGNQIGKIQNRTGIKSLMGYLEPNTDLELSLSVKSASMVYVLGGNIEIEGTTVKEKQLAILDDEGTALRIKANETSRLLILEGKPIEEKVVSWGPYVMNTQREILEAMRDYNEGRMGFLAS